MRRIFVRFLGIFLILFGLVGVFTPIPLGILFLGLGLVCLIPTSPRAANTLRRARRKSDRFDGALSRLEKRAPTPYRRVLRSTGRDPRHHTW